MRKFILLVLSIVGISSVMYAHEADTLVVHNPRTGAPEVIDLPEAMTEQLDSLLNDWLAKNHLAPLADCRGVSVNPSFNDSAYADRLSRIPSVMEMPYNNVVRKFIDQYSGKLNGTVSYMLGAMNFYMPIFEEVLDKYDLPNELKYLPIIESALKPSAVSRAGASGLWQFMLKTAKLYGLKSNSLIDERRDPIKSPHAAARYLTELYAIYGDWNLVIAAYNCGPGNVNKAIHRSGGATDYWTIYNHLPRETRGYVPAFIAANYIMNYYCLHGISPMNSELPMATDTLMISRDIHFGQVSDLCKLDIEVIRALNPQYKKDMVPGNSMECILRLPNEAVATFIDYGDSIYQHRAAQYLKKRRYVAIKDDAGLTTTGKAKYHTIRQGETLSTIARRYGTTVNKLRALNNMKNNKIRAGKRLRVL